MNALIICLTIIICIISLCVLIYKIFKDIADNEIYLNDAVNDIISINNYINTIDIKNLYNEHATKSLNSIKNITNKYVEDDTKEEDVIL